MIIVDLVRALSAQQAPKDIKNETNPASIVVDDNTGCRTLGYRLPTSLTEALDGATVAAQQMSNQGIGELCAIACVS